MNMNPLPIVLMVTGAVWIMVLDNATEFPGTVLLIVGMYFYFSTSNTHENR